MKYFYSILMMLYCSCTNSEHKSKTIKPKPNKNDTLSKIDENQIDDTLYCITFKASDTSKIQCLSKLNNEFYKFSLFYDTIQFGENGKTHVLEESMKIIYLKTKDTITLNLNYMINNIFLDAMKRTLYYQKRDLEELKKGEDMNRINIYKLRIDKDEPRQKIASYTDDELMKWNLNYMNRSDGVAFWNKFFKDKR
jgi:hypothetical protein